MPGLEPATGRNKISAAPPQRATLASRTARLIGSSGAVVVGIMLVLCVGTLPFTLARVAGTAGQTGIVQRRYEATNLEGALLPPFWAPHATDEAAQIQAFQQRGEPAPQPWLGTDRLGRSVLVRCLAGGGVSLGIGVAAAMLAVVIGTLYGTIAGYSGGRTDAAMMRIVDILYGLPYILLVVLLAVAVDGLIESVNLSRREPGLWNSVRYALASNKPMLNTVTLLVAIGGVSWLTMARVIRGQVLSLKQQPFMEACRAIGVPLHRQFTHHLLPNLLGPIIVYATLTVPTAILSESFLSFLGIGVKEPLPSWGNMAAAGLNELNVVRARWWLLLWPCLFVGVTLLGLNFMGEALRERFDPRRRTTAAAREVPRDVESPVPPSP